MRDWKQAEIEVGLIEVDNSVGMVRMHERRALGWLKEMKDGERLRDRAKAAQAFIDNAYLEQESWVYVVAQIANLARAGEED